MPGGGGNLILKQLLSLASVGQQFCGALRAIYRVREKRDPVLTGPFNISSLCLVDCHMVVVKRFDRSQGLLV